MTGSHGRKIMTNRQVSAVVGLPPSKSYTNRALIAAALASGDSTIVNPSQGDDSRHLLSALRHFGIVTIAEDNRVTITGTDGQPSPPSGELFIGNAGTAMRFLTSFACLAAGATTITGDEQMKKRPISDLLESLRESGIRCTSEHGFPPVTVHGGEFAGGNIDVEGSVSSQFLSSLLLCAPYARRPVTLRVKGNLRSRPYIEMTLHVMRSFGADVVTAGTTGYAVSNRDRYLGREFTIEGDATSATYFAAAAAITGGRVRLPGFLRDSLQGDAAFMGILAQMGSEIIEDEDGIEVRGGELTGAEFEMNDLPDCVPTLAVVGLFARGSTTMTNIGHLRHKETDRLQALATEIGKLGGSVDLGADSLTIHPGALHGSPIATYNDHRMAMSFAVAGLALPGVQIMNPECVTKSFPNFWSEFSKLEQPE